MKKIILCCVIALFYVLDNTFAQGVTPKESEGFYSFEFDEFYFEVDGNEGGKNSSFTINDREILYMDNSEFLWGSVLWPSPQDEWGWPPADELDLDPYEGTLTDSSFILTSDIDPKTGLLFKKQFYVSTEGEFVTNAYRMINKSGNTKSNAAWEVTRVPCGGLTFFPMGEGDFWGDLSELFVIDNGIVYYEFNDTDQGGRKFFSDGSEGWFAHVTDDGLLFVKAFEDVPKDQQAPNEAEIEVWLTGGHSYIELENQGVYTELADGDSVDYNVKWYLRELPENISVEIGNMELVNHVRDLVADVPVNIADRVADDNTFHIYPNPVIRTIHFTGLPKGTYHFRVFDISGKLLLNRPNINIDNDVSSEGLTSGMYYYMMSSSENTWTGQFEVIK